MRLTGSDSGMNAPISDACMGRIAREHGAVLRFAPAGTMRDLSSSDRLASPPSITLGTYANPEARAADFFHELGHCVNTSDTVIATMGNELRAWITGFEIASAAGVTFSTSEVARCFRELSSYLGTDASADDRLWHDAKGW